MTNEIIYSVSTRNKADYTTELVYGKVGRNGTYPQAAYVIRSRMGEEIYVDTDAIDALIAALILLRESDKDRVR